MLKAIPPFAVLLILISFSSCQKLECCGYPTYYCQCNKGNINAQFFVSGTVSNVQNLLNDTLNVYIANGYTCTTQGGGAFSAFCAVGLIKINEAKQAGNVCTDPIDAYCSNSVNDPECGQ
jgi:hypothetical protein